MTTIFEQGEEAFKKLMEGGKIREVYLFQYLDVLSNYPARIRGVGSIPEAQKRAKEQIVQLVELIMKQINK